jgi:RimJ/RimL family protein N-acetyltransferase
MNDGLNNPRMLSIREKLARMAPRRAIEVLGPETLRTDRLILRPLMGKDRAQFTRAIATSRADLEPYYDLWRPGDSDDAVFDRQIELTRVGATTGRACRRGAFLEDGRFVGCFHLNDIRRGLDFTAEASWWVRSDLGRMGLGTEGVRGMLEYAVGNSLGGLGLAQVFAFLHPENAQSRRLAERVGMHVFRGQTANVELHGSWVPHVIYRKQAAIAA